MPNPLPAGKAGRRDGEKEDFGVRPPMVIVKDMSETERDRMDEERRGMDEERGAMTAEREVFERDLDKFAEERKRYQEERIVLQGDLNTAHKVSAVGRLVL